MKQEGNKQYFESMWEYVKDSYNDFDNANTFGNAPDGSTKIITKKILDDTDFAVIDQYIEKDGITYSRVSWNENDGVEYYIPEKDLDDEFFLVIYAQNGTDGVTLWATLSGKLHRTEEDAQREIDGQK